MVALGVFIIVLGICTFAFSYNSEDGGLGHMISVLLVSVGIALAIGGAVG